MKNNNNLKLTMFKHSSNISKNIKKLRDIRKKMIWI